MARIFGILIAVLFLSLGHTASAQYSSELLKKAQYGDAEAQFRLGNAYKTGRGVIQDFVEAIKWYRLAAEQGYADAQNYLGVAYDSGDGVEQDFVEAIKWYRLAAEQGNAEAQINLGNFYYNDFFSIAKVLSKTS